MLCVAGISITVGFIISITKIKYYISARISKNVVTNEYPSSTRSNISLIFYKKQTNLGYNLKKLNNLNFPDGRLFTYSTIGRRKYHESKKNCPIFLFAAYRSWEKTMEVRKGQGKINMCGASLIGKFLA